MDATDFVIYAYGLVPRDSANARFPAGIDDAPVEVHRTPVAGVLLSRLPASHYAPGIIEQSSGEVSWLSPRAMAHDRVLTWAQEHGGVIPLPMFTMFGSEDALMHSLGERAQGIERAFRRVAGADEFGVRIHRRHERMLAAIDRLDPDLDALRREAAKAPPGQRYLLERKIDERARTSVRAVSQRIAREVYDALRIIARDAVARPLTPDASRTDVTLVLNGAFLVDRPRVDEFRAAVGARIREHEPSGLAFDFSGPWPPYNFVAEAMNASSDAGAGGGAARP
jgi:hypothetical protein